MSEKGLSGPALFDPARWGKAARVAGAPGETTGSPAQAGCTAEVFEHRTHHAITTGRYPGLPAPNSKQMDARAGPAREGEQASLGVPAPGLGEMWTSGAVGACRDCARLLTRRGRLSDVRRVLAIQVAMAQSLMHPAHWRIRKPCARMHASPAELPSRYAGLPFAPQCSLVRVTGCGDARRSSRSFTARRTW